MNKVFQLKVTLLDSKPPIWRVIEVFDSDSFYKLHMVIQHAMRWDDYHLHNFALSSSRKNGKVTLIGVKSDDELDNDPDELDGFVEKLSKYADVFEKGKIVYTYDFGDNWELKIELQATFPPEKGVDYPRCIQGEQASPPEDCGGIDGYYYFLEAYKDKKHEDYATARDMFGKGFDPNHFDVNELFGE